MKSNAIEPWIRFVCLNQVKRYRWYAYPMIIIQVVSKIREFPMTDYRHPPQREMTDGLTPSGCLFLIALFVFITVIGVVLG